MNNPIHGLFLLNSPLFFLKSKPFIYMLWSYQTNELLITYKIPTTIPTRIASIPTS